MSAIPFNIAKGRAAEFYQRVDSNDPANSALIIVILDSNVQADATLQDYDTLAAILAANAEPTNVNYARKTLTDADLGALTIDDTNNRVDLDIPDQTWSSVGAGTSWGKLLVCYDSDTTAGTDANIIPISMHDFVAVPSGAAITAQINSAGFYRAA